MNAQNESTVLKRVLYYPGQKLTAQDFKDEQEYFRNKFNQLSKRFPKGIINGLLVTLNNDKSSIHIEVGAGVNGNGDILTIAENQTVYVKDTKATVGEKGIAISQDNWDLKEGSKLYVNLSQRLDPVVKGNSLIESSGKSNRMEETVKITFDLSPENPTAKADGTISIAVLEKKDNCLKVSTDEKTVKSRIFKEENVSFDDKGHNHSGGEKGAKIGKDSIVENAVTSDKIAEWVNTDEKRLKTGIDEKHLRNEAVTKDKIKDGQVTESKLKIIEPQKKSLSPGIKKGSSQSFDVATGTNCIIRVLPSCDGEISWNISGVKSKKQGAEMTSVTTIQVKYETDGITELEFKAIKFGECKSTITITSGEVLPPPKPSDSENIK